MSATEERLQAVVRDLESYAAAAGWDQPAKLFALVETAELQRAGVEIVGSGDADPQSLTPVEQEPVAGAELEDLLAEISWPEVVSGAAAVVERVVLPPAAEEQLPEEPDAARKWAAEHPEREGVRLVAAVMRDGAAYCALRLRTHDEPTSVVTGPDLVPTLVQLLRATFDPEEELSGE